MRCFTAILLLSVSVLFSGCSTPGLHTMMSPELRQFMVTHPGASESFTNVLSEAFAGRSVKLRYFHRVDTNATGAFHYYPHKSSVVIRIREGMQPCDQCICLIFEILNSEGEMQFQALFKEAQAGTISRTNFAICVLRQEFKAVERMKALLPHFAFSKTEMAESKYYSEVMDSPNTFDEFLSYSQILWSKGYDRISYYERQYDFLRKEE